MLPLLTCLLCVGAPDLRLVPNPAVPASAPADDGRSAIGAHPIAWIIPDGLVLAATATAYALPALRGIAVRRQALDSLGAAALHLATDAVAVTAAYLWVGGEKADFREQIAAIAAGLIVGSLVAPLGAMLADRWQGHAPSLGALLVTEGVVLGVDLLSVWGLLASSGTSTVGTAAAIGLSPLSLWGWSAGVYTVFAR